MSGSQIIIAFIGSQQNLKADPDPIPAAESITMLKRELQRMASIGRNGVLAVAFFTLIFFATSRGIADAHLSLSPMPFLRGGYTAFAPVAKPIDRKHRHPNPLLLGLDNLQRTIDIIGNKIQSETVKHWSDLHDNVEREWGKLTSSIGKIFSGKERHGTKKLDEVLRAFRSVLNGSEVDTAQLIKACRAHLVLMKSGGAALRVVAKDMEANLNKAEALFNKLPKEGKHLASLLQTERESGIHDGNILQEASAAMGLLWIRRSLAFQLDLYSSLVTANGPHPKAAASGAYQKHLSPYHGWMLQKVFPASFQGMPDRQTFIAKFGGREAGDLNEEDEKEIVKKLKMLVTMWEPIVNTWRDEFERLDLEDTRRV